MWTCVENFWCPIPWVWYEDLCTSQNFRFCDFRNTTPLTVFIRFQPNFIQSIIIRDKDRLLLFLATCQKLQKLWHFEICVNTGPYGPGNFKTLLILQFSSDPIQTLWEHCLPWGNAGYYSSWQSANFYKIYGTLKFSHWSEWKNLKCWISRKRMIVERNGQKFRTQGITVHVWRLLLMPDSLSLVWGHSVHFAKFPILQFLKLCSSPNFHPIHPNVIQGILMMGQYRLHVLRFWRSAKNCGILKFFLPWDHMQLEISKCYFSHNLHWSPSKLYDNI